MYHVYLMYQVYHMYLMYPTYTKVSIKIRYDI